MLEEQHQQFSSYILPVRNGAESMTQVFCHPRKEIVTIDGSNQGGSPFIFLSQSGTPAPLTTILAAWNLGGSTRLCTILAFVNRRYLPDRNNRLFPIRNLSSHGRRQLKKRRNTKAGYLAFYKEVGRPVEVARFYACYKQR